MNTRDQHATPKYPGMLSEFIGNGLRQSAALVHTGMDHTWRCAGGGKYISFHINKKTSAKFTTVHLKHTNNPITETPPRAAPTQSFQLLPFVYALTHSQHAHLFTRTKYLIANIDPLVGKGYNYLHEES